MKSLFYFVTPKVFTPYFLGGCVLALSACQPVTLTESGLQTNISTPSLPKQAETLSTQKQVTTQSKKPAEEFPEEKITETLADEAIIETAKLASLAAIEPAAKLPKITTIDPKKFLGKTSEFIAGQLGEPDFKRREGQIGIWQYRQANCVVDFFFQNTHNPPNLSQKPAIALDIRKRIIGQPLNEERCQKELYQRQL